MSSSSSEESGSLPELVFEPCQYVPAPVRVEGVPQRIWALLYGNTTLVHRDSTSQRDRIKTIYGEVVFARAANISNTREVTYEQEIKAVKIYYKEKIQSLNIGEDHERELRIQRYLATPKPHPNVMPCEACLCDQLRYFAVLPYASGGELFEWVAYGQGQVPESLLGRMFLGMARAIEYLHRRGIVHLDVSLENYVLESRQTLNPILIDFGLSRVLEFDESGNPVGIVYDGRTGKPNYRSPESFLITQLIALNKRKGIAPKQYTFDGMKQDVWALGVCLYMMIFRNTLWKFPYPKDAAYNQCIVKRDLRGYFVQHMGFQAQHDEANPDRIKQYITNTGFTVSEPLVDFLQFTLQAEPQDRPTIEQIFQHPWLQQFLL